MEHDFKVGDKVILSYLSKFGTGRKAVVNGAVTRLDDDGISVKVGIRETSVVWDDVFALRVV